MMIIMDSNAIFKVQINPFIQEIKVSHLNSGDKCTYNYTDIDEWFSCEFDQKYDFHFLYDDGLKFSIYPVDGNNEADYKKAIPYSLDVILQ